MDLDWRQKYALKKLTICESASFGELTPPDVDGNLFAYHMTKLIKQKLVKSVKGQYTLTPQGKHFVGSLSIDTGMPRKQPKIVVMLYAENTKGEILLYKWLRQPYYNKVSLPYGKTHFDKSLSENVLHEADMKLSVPVMSQKYFGDFYQTIQEGEVVISHMLVHLFKITVDENLALQSKQSGEAFWADIHNISTDNLMPGLYEILNLAQGQSEVRITEFKHSYFTQKELND